MYVSKFLTVNKIIFIFLYEEIDVTAVPSSRTNTVANDLLPTGLTLSCALHEFVVGLELLWTDMVAPPTEQVQAWPAPRTRLTAHTRLTVCRAPCNGSAPVSDAFMTVVVLAQSHLSVYLYPTPSPCSFKLRYKGLVGEIYPYEMGHLFNKINH